ncbi:MAG: ATP-dependent Clp protease ATP-binding subunit [Defluviitaleaceae bacterium]|nr:ATP-dependent Clp protease ATP-binding subunit [Defluviitaleaceae bacterium]
MPQGNFTQKSKEVIEASRKLAGEFGHAYIGTEHILLALVHVEDSVAYETLDNNDISELDVEEKIEQMTGITDEQNTPKDFTPRTKRLLENSHNVSVEVGSSYIGTEHILLAITRDTESLAFKILIALKININSLIEEIYERIGAGGAMTMGANMQNPFMNMPNNSNDPKSKSKNGTPVLDKFSRDFTSIAKDGIFDPIIGREKEIERIIQILSRRTKNNPVLVGDPGVGKTAVIEGLAQKITSGEVPELLKTKRVVSLDMNAVVAGTKYRGEFEERMKKILEELKNTKNIILFIDEIHTIIGAGGADGSLDASNILKPSLSRGEIQVVGATTMDEYRRYIEKNAALERRFQPVNVEEPTEEEAIRMLYGLRDKYEAHHSVKITNEALEAAVRLSARYITDRFLPDKAIDLLDESASKIRLLSYTAPPKITEIEKELEDLEKEKEEAIKTESFEKAGVIKQKENELKTQLKEEKEKWQSGTKKESIVDEVAIADVVTNWTGVPVQKIQSDEKSKLINLEEDLHERVIGQDEAVKSISRAIRRGRVGLKDPKRPIGSFLFLGPTGVGKTELCKALANTLFGDDNAMIRLDMSEFMEKHTVSKLIGSPPGFVGYNDGGHFSEKIRRRPYSVVLLDEIEKAHPDIFNILLQVLEDGHITDSQGRKVSFKNTVIIMTSNAGAKSIINPKKLGFTSNTTAEKSYEDMKKNVMNEIKDIFRPEFLNRIDDITVFHPLSEDDIKEIATKMINEVIDRVKENMQITLFVTNEAVEQISKEGFDTAFGARPLRRAIQAKIEDRLAEEVLSGTILEGEKAEIDYKEEEFVVKKMS